jgi:hypothetical protein
VFHGTELNKRGRAVAVKNQQIKRDDIKSVAFSLSRGAFIISRRTFFHRNKTSTLYNNFLESRMVLKKS